MTYFIHEGCSGSESCTGQVKIHISNDTAASRNTTLTTTNVTRFQLDQGLRFNEKDGDEVVPIALRASGGRSTGGSRSTSGSRGSSSKGSSSRSGSSSSSTGYKGTGRYGSSPGGTYYYCSSHHDQGYCTTNLGLTVSDLILIIVFGSLGGCCIGFPLYAIMLKKFCGRSLFDEAGNISPFGVTDFNKVAVSTYDGAYGVTVSTYDGADGGAVNTFNGAYGGGAVNTFDGITQDL